VDLATSVLAGTRATIATHLGSPVAVSDCRVADYDSRWKGRSRQRHRRHVRRRKNHGRLATHRVTKVSRAWWHYGRCRDHRWLWWELLRTDTIRIAARVLCKGSLIDGGAGQGG